MINDKEESTKQTTKQNQEHIAIFDLVGVLVNMTADDGKTPWGAYIKAEYPQMFERYENGNSAMVHMFESFLEELYVREEIIAHPVEGALDLLKYSKENGYKNINYTTCTKEFATTIFSHLLEGKYKENIDEVISQLDMFPNDPKSKSVEGFKKILEGRVGEFFVDDKIEPLLNAQSAYANMRLYNLSNKEVDLPKGIIKVPSMQEILRYEKNSYRE